MAKVELEILVLSDSNASNNSFAVVLGEKEGKRRLPIIIGPFEAQAIAVELERMKPQRPLTHDLFVNFAQSFQIYLSEVIIRDLKEGIFFSTLICKQDKHTVEIDSRTSDAIALAIRFGCPIYTFEHIMDSANIDYDFNSESEEGKQAVPIKKIEPKEAKPNLEERLNKAIAAEDYELAARIRDEIQKRDNDKS